jgi:tRNA A-37 threonylcarbamoyl transferase component Bud32
MEGLDTVVQNGVRWRVRPEYRKPLFAGQGLRLAECDGQACVVKHGPHRTVYRLAVSDFECYVKHYRLPDSRAWLRQLVRPSKARTEYDRAVAVAERRVPTALPLAFGESCGRHGPRESFLITRGLEGTENLNRFAETTFPQLPLPRQTCVRKLLAEELGQLLARMHDVGITHNDLHAGNLHIRLGAEDRIELFLIDLHAVRLGRPLGWRRSRDNLVMLNHWFVLHGSRNDRLRFWHAYAAARGGGMARATFAARARELETGTWASNLRFWRHRDRRCLRSNRYYQRCQSWQVSGYAIRDLDAAALSIFVADPDAVLQRPGVTLLKNSRSSTVAELDLSINGVPRRVIYKRFQVTAWSDPWITLVRRSAALRSWVFGHGLRERGLPTARPLAVFHRRRGGLSQDGYLLTEKIPDALELHRYVADLDMSSPPARRQRLRTSIAQIARLLRELHRRQLSHRDLKAANILMSSAACPWSVPAVASESRQPWLIDLVGLRLYRKLSRARRVQNLARLHASFQQHPLISRTDKLRFLRVYLQWGLRGRAGWKRWWREVAQATQAKVARNLRTGRPLA